MGNKRNRNKAKPPGRQRVFTVPPERMGVPPVWNPKNPILQAIGAHTPGGVMRLVLILMHKFDPTGAGVLVTGEDLKRIAELAVEQGRDQLTVSGQHDAILLRMVNAQEARVAMAAENAMAAAGGRPQTPLPPEGQLPGEPG